VEYVTSKTSLPHLTVSTADLGTDTAVQSLAVPSLLLFQRSKWGTCQDCGRHSCEGRTPVCLTAEEWKAGPMTGRYREKQTDHYSRNTHRNHCVISYVPTTGGREKETTRLPLEEVTVSISCGPMTGGTEGKQADYYSLNTRRSHGVNKSWPYDREVRGGTGRLLLA